MRVFSVLRRLWLLLALLPGAVAAPVQAADRPGEGPQVSLVTFAPGFVYWQSYGHNALLVRAPGLEPLLFNYGMFDFEQENFFLNFARGRMQYQLVVQPLTPMIGVYREQNRWMREQPLRLTPEQAQALVDFLVWNAQPENAEYRYDYFRANCSTRVRDALDRVLGGRLQARLEREPADRNYRDEAVRHMAGSAALMLGVDALLGPHTDAPISRWQQSFLPLTLMQVVAEQRLDDGTPLAGEARWLLQAGEAPALEHAPRWRVPMLGIGLALGALLLALRGRALRALALGLSLAGGLVGVVLLLGWIATDHWTMAANRNLLLFSPLSLLLLPACAGRTGKFSSALAALIAAGALLAPLLLLLLPQAQPNAHWIALWLPVHLALAWRLHRLRTRPET